MNQPTTLIHAAPGPTEVVVHHLLFLQSKVRAELEREQVEILQMHERDYKQMQKHVNKFWKSLELQQQQEQHQRWAQLTAERQAYRKLATVSRAVDRGGCDVTLGFIPRHVL